MKKKICAVCIFCVVFISTVSATAFAYSASGSGFMFDDNGFYYTADGISPEYGWLYAPDGRLLQEGFLKEYKYKPERGMASVTFEGGTSYYTSPSNLIYRTYTIAERQAIGRP